MFHHCNGFPNDDNHWFILLAPPLARLRQGFTLYPWLTWNLLCRQADLNSQRSTCLFLNSGIKELCYCTQLYSDFWNSVIVWAQFKNSEICYITYKSEVCHKRMPMYGKKNIGLRSNHMEPYLFGCSRLFCQFSILPLWKKQDIFFSHATYFWLLWSLLGPGQTELLEKRAAMTSSAPPDHQRIRERKGEKRGDPVRMTGIWEMLCLYSEFQEDIV